MSFLLLLALSAHAALPPRTGQAHEGVDFGSNDEGTRVVACWGIVGLEGKCVHKGNASVGGSYRQYVRGDMEGGRPRIWEDGTRVSSSPRSNALRLNSPSTTPG